MTITENKVASIHYKLTGDDGEILDSSEGREPLDYLHGHNNIVNGLEKALTGKAQGDAVKVSVSPEEGYGAHDPEMIVDVPREHLPVLNLEEGMQFSAETSGGMRLFTVREIGEDTVKLDGNHPLAGETLHFDVEVIGVRDATDEELQHGHVHAGGCCGGGGCCGDEEHEHSHEKEERGGCGSGCGCGH